MPTPVKICGVREVLINHGCDYAACDAPAKFTIEFTLPRYRHPPVTLYLCAACTENVEDLHMLSD